MKHINFSLSCEKEDVKFNYWKLMSASNTEFISLKLQVSEDKTFFDEVFKVAKEKNVVKLVLEYEYMEDIIVMFLSLSTISELTLKFLYSSPNGYLAMKKPIQELKSLKKLSIFDIELDFLPELKDLEILKLTRILLLDESFHRIFGNSKLKKIQLTDITVSEFFKLKIDLTSLEKFILKAAYFNFQNLYELLKGKSYLKTFEITEMDLPNNTLPYILFIFNEIKIDTAVFNWNFSSTHKSNFKYSIKELVTHFIYNFKSFLSFLEENNNLENFGLISNQSKTNNDLLFKSLQKFEIKELLIMNSELNLLTFMEYLEKNTKLESLSLLWNNLDGSLKDFNSYLKTNKTIKRFSFSGMDDFTDLPYINENIENLNLDNFNVQTSEFKKYLHFLKEKKNLKKLGLSFNSQIILPLILYLSSNPKLKCLKLNFEETEVKDEYDGVIGNILNSLYKNTNLEKISFNDSTDSKYTFKQIYHFFLFNYSICSFKVNGNTKYKSVIEYYTNRNKELKKIYQLTNIYLDISFKFDKQI